MSSFFEFTVLFHAILKSLNVWLGFVVGIFGLFFFFFEVIERFGSILNVLNSGSGCL